MYHIETIELYLRETPPGRMAFSLGKRGGSGNTTTAITNPLAHVRLVLGDSQGNTTFGCSADRLSVRWLDKRAGRNRSLKLRELVALIEEAREVYLASPNFESPFSQWRVCHSQIMQAGRRTNQEDLTSSFASALIERAIVDAVCRLHRMSLFEMVKQNRLGIRPTEVNPTLSEELLKLSLPASPQTDFWIRHTVGLADPLNDEDWPARNRVNDGLPETLEQYIREDGVRYFKVKISGDVDRDLQRLARVWEVALLANEPVLTLDANEAYDDLGQLLTLVRRCDRELTGLFQHLRYIEQPLTRRTTLDAHTTRSIKQISQYKPLIIDEADGTLDAFSRASEIGYQGTSHKNCKGFFKSLLNRVLVTKQARAGQESFLSGEDLQNLPVVPLHQDFAALGVLGITHCERNGHHYNFGLSFLSDRDKQSAVRHHPDMYARRGDEYFLNVRGGMVTCASLQCPGFGVHDEPDWNSMQPLREWINKTHSGA